MLDALPDSLPDASQLALVAAIAFAGALTQSAIGFGFGIVFAPLATLLVGVQSAVATSIVLGTVLAIALTIESRPRNAFGPVTPVAVLGTLATPLGIWVLAHAPEATVRVLVALAVLGGAVVTLGSRPREVARAGSLLTASAVGVLSGLLRGSTSMSGPPVVLYLHWLGGGAEVIRNRLFGYFALLAISAVPLAWWGGVIGAAEGWQALTSTPAVLAGVLGGRPVRARLSEAAFRAGTLALLVVTSAVAIAQAFLARA